MNLTEEQRRKINQFIAEKLGWRKSQNGGGLWFTPESGKWPASGCFNCPVELPDYTRSLEACHDAEEMLDDCSQWVGEEHHVNAVEAYMGHLGSVTKTRRFPDDWECIHSTAEQRALALFQTLGGVL